MLLGILSTAGDLKSGDVLERARAPAPRRGARFLLSELPALLDVRPPLLDEEVDRLLARDFICAVRLSLRAGSGL